MILGVGLDLASIPDMREQLALPGTTFAHGTFTEGERRYAASNPDPARHLAARFAAKEALIKAWSGGAFGRTPVLASPDLREIEVVSDSHGRPALRLHGAVAAALAAALGPVRVHLSLTHEAQMAAAVVILEAAAP